MQLQKILSEISACLPARRGRLFEQHFTRTCPDGSVRKTGPYYVLTRSVGGRTVSQRVSAADAPGVRADLERGEKLRALFERIWEMAEGMAAEASGPKKKRPCAKSRIRS